MTCRSPTRLTGLLDGDGDPGLHSQLEHDLADMTLHRSLRQVQPRADSGVAHSFGDKDRDLVLAST